MQADVELGAHRGQRRAQLVRRVGDQPVLLLDAALEAVEHRVQRHGEVADLVLRARHSMRSCRRSIPISSAFEVMRSTGRKRLARQPPAAERGGRERGRQAGQQEQHQHLVDRLVDLPQGLRDDQHALLAPALRPAATIAR